MSMILRCAKAFRPTAVLARSLLFNSHHVPEGPSRTFTQRRLNSTIQRSDKNVDRSIKKLDQEIRRTGRITSRDIEDGLEQIRHKRSVTSAQSLLLIRCCGNLVPDELPKVRTAYVRKVWQTLNNLNVPLDISHYNALLQVYLENEHSYHPTEILADMEAKGIEPNRVTYQRFISQYCQQGDIDGATKVVEFMREEKLPINEHVFNALIMGHSESNDIESAIGILSTMKTAGLEPTSDTHTELMCAYAKHGKTDEILSTLDMCEANGIQLLDKDLFKVIYKLATNGHSDYVDNILPRLRKLSGYNQYAENLIVRLVNRCREDVAFQIVKTTVPDDESFETGAIFIRQLMKSGRPTEKILSFCRELQQTGLNSRAILIAAEAASASGNIDIAVPFFREVKRNELPLQQEYFWPLICTQGKGGTNVLDVLRIMQSEFDVTANGETVRDYVIPNLKERNYEKLILTLQLSGIPKPIAVTSCVCHALTSSRIKVAATLASTYAIYYQPSLLRRPLVDALSSTNDFRSWVSIVRSVHENLPRLQKIENAGAIEGDNSRNQTQSEVVGMFVVDAVIRLQESRAEATEKILSALIEQGLSVSKSHAERIKERSRLLTPKISFWIDKLTSGELEPVPYKSLASKFNFSDIMSTKNLDEMIQEKEAKGEYITGLQWALLQAHLKANDVQKTEVLIEKLLNSGFVVATPLYAQLIELYCRNSDLDKALAVYGEVKLKEPGFVLDDLKTLKVVHELVRNDRIDEAVEFIKSGKRSQKLKGALDNASCWRLFNHLADKGRVADLTKVFNALEESNFIQANNVLLGLLIKVHLVNNDITKAIATFKLISTKYKCTPWKNELSCTLIQSKDATGLQLLVDLSTKIHGEVNSLYDLVFSFVECGCIQQARKILTTPALHRHPQALVGACERYRRERKTASLTLETLVQATSDLKNIDRHEIFYNLLLAYCTEDSPIKAMNLWTKIQKDEEVAVTDKFLTTLACFLNEKGVKVPFDVPGTIDAAAGIKKPKTSLKADVVGDGIKTKVDSNAEPNVTRETKMLETMVKENQFNNATHHILKMLEANTYPSTKAFRLYLNGMAKTGHYEALEQLSPRLSPDVKRKLLFDNRLGAAYASAGKAGRFFDQMMTNCNNATTEEELKQAFPSGAISGILGKHPELIGKFETFAVNMAEREFFTPINTMWLHHIENGNLDRADRIMKTYLRESPTIMFNSLLRTAHYRKDDTIVLSLLNALAEKNVSKSDLATIHSCLIDVYCSKQKFDEALMAVDSAIRDVSMEDIKRTTLVSVKDGLESEGKAFPYKIPDKEQINAAGARISSSNDELRDKWADFKQILVNIFEENVNI